LFAGRAVGKGRRGVLPDKATRVVPQKIVDSLRPTPQPLKYQRFEKHRLSPCSNSLMQILSSIHMGMYEAESGTILSLVRLCAMRGWLHYIFLLGL